MTYLRVSLAAMIVWAPLTQAGVMFSPKISIESQGYETDFTSGDYVSAGGGFTVFNQDGWFLDAEFFRNNGDSRVVGEVTREETTLTVGKSLGNGLSVFGGYKIARSIGVDELTSTLINVKEIEIDTDGVFLGVSKGVSVSDSGSLSFAGAISPMSARITQEDNNTGDDIVTTGSAVGMSLSGSYNHMLTKQWVSSIGYKFQKFSYGTNIGDETVTALFGKLAYRF